jgi:DNA-binding beta-propeller fold protein YncE
VTRRLAALVLAVVAAAGAGPAAAAPTRSAPIAVAGDGHVFVVNPDQDTVARLEFDAMHVGTLTHERAVGRYPRTVALAGSWAYTADQTADSLSRLDQADLGNRSTVGLGAGCGPYGVAATPAGDRVLVTCQGTSELLILSPDLVVLARVPLEWPNARAIAVSDAGRAYVTHYLTEEPGSDAHVSVVDVASATRVVVFAVPADLSTCETQNSGQGPLNLVSAIALVPPGAPAEVANQVWIGGVEQNNLNKGLFKRSLVLGKHPEAPLFPFSFSPFPKKGNTRDVFKASFHDIIRSALFKLDATTGQVLGKIDIDEGSQVSDIAFSPDGTTAHVVDLGFNSYHVFNTVRGQRPNDVTTLFAAPSRFGPGGAQGADSSCVTEALAAVVSEVPYRISPQAQISVIDGIDPFRFDGASFVTVATGVDFDVATYHASGVSQMIPVADGVGTGPMGVALSPDGTVVYVANYLSRNVVPVATAFPPDAGGRPENFRCSNAPTTRCGTTNDCAGGPGFCNHPGGQVCATDADCPANGGPCVLSAQCVPLVLGPATSSLQGGIASDRLHASLLDGKIFFSTAARDSSVPNNVGLDNAAPLFNDPKLECLNAPGVACRVRGTQCASCANDATHLCTSDADCSGSSCVLPLPGERLRQPSTCSNNPLAYCNRDADCGPGAQCLTLCRVSTTLPGAVVSTSHDASYVTCQTCHADFGGQDGRTWDFSQLGVSLRNTMDLRGRAGFAPGACSNDPATQCFFDAACGDGNVCKADPSTIPPNVPAADRDRWFNPMLTIHWNGDRDEVEDFENTFRSLQGAGDCDAAEHAANTCMGGLVQRSIFTSMDPVDIHPDEGPPNRNLRGKLHPEWNVGIRLTHLADFVYSLTDFVRNPNPPGPSVERGRRIFNDPQTKCVTCHSGGPTGKEFFTDKRVLRQGFDASRPGGPDVNNPFFRHDVGTGNLFDRTDPNAIASANQTFQNTVVPIPGSRGSLAEYVTPVLVDLWNTAPYLHDGSAATLLDVVRACDNAVDNCFRTGRGRNVNRQHGVTDMLTPQQLNDLVAFQNALTTDAAVFEQRFLNPGVLALRRAVVTFPRVPKRRNARRKRIGSFVVQGTLAGAPAPVDPSAQPVVFSIATPGGEEMVILSRSINMRGRGRRTVGRSADRRVRVVLQGIRGGGFRFTAEGKRVDIVDLDTGNRDLSVAFEIGPVTFASNRNLAGKKNVFKLPRRRR